MESTTLYYRSGSSDKVYHVTLEQRKDGWVVNTQFGRRGSAQQTGTKTPVAVDYGAARAIYERLVDEKKAKGYTAGEDGVPYSQAENVDKHTGIMPQLLNPIGGDEIGALIQSPYWWMQEKHDGQRRLIRKTGGEVIGINRRGLQVDVPQPWVEDCRRCSGDFLIDGEAVGETLYVFDILSMNGEDLRARPYLERYLHLMQLLTKWGSRCCRIVKTICTDGEKKRYFDELKLRGAEGVVFRKVDEPYTSGRPASNGPSLKWKFVESASFIVTRVNEQRSVALALLDDGVARSAGNVTIPPNHSIPNIGQVVEVRYLYTFEESGNIYQPVYLGVRQDIPQEECTVSQLKYKVNVEEEMAA